MYTCNHNICVVYPTTSNREPENLKLKDHIQRNLFSILKKYPNALILITGDFNPNSTGLKGIGNKKILLFHAKEHEKMSQLAVYCKRLCLLVPKLFAKMWKI